MRARRKLGMLLSVLGVTAAMVVVAPGTAIASVIQNPPYADMNCSHYGGPDFPDGLDTRQSCLNAAAVLGSAGYHAFANNEGPTASQIMGAAYAQSDAIWATFGHANGGFITTYNGSVGRSDLAVMSGLSGSCAGKDACLSSYTSAQLSRIKLMMFGGCYTGTSYGGRGNNYILPRVVVFSKGVDAAVGWVGEISWPAMDIWTQAFFQSGDTFFNAAIYAENQTKAGNHGDLGGTNTSIWYGNWNLHVRPAGYGN